MDAVGQNVAGNCYLDGVTIWGGFVLVARVYKHMATLRETEDKLYTDFAQPYSKGERADLNRERAEYVFNNLYIPDAQ